MITTTKLRNGVTVLAKETKFGINAFSYSNDKQANNKKNELLKMGIQCNIYIPFGSPVRFIKINK